MTDRDVFQPGKLWSLWDMLEIKAQPFMTALTSFSAIQEIIANGARKGSQEMDAPASATVAKFLKRDLKTLREGCVALDATNSVGEIDFILRQMRSGVPLKQLGGLIEGLNRFFLREVGGTKLFTLEQGKSKYYGKAAEVFGMEAVVAFPRAEYDLEEAGRSLACGRNTACVYHLMKAMETVLQALCKRLGLPNVDKRWGSLLSDIDTAMKPLKDDEHKAKWSQARSNLWHVKEAWRNDTMHPGDKYTDAEAAEVLDAVRVFIKSLSTLTASPP